MLPAVSTNGSVLAATTGTPANRLPALFDRFFRDDPLFGPLMTAPMWTALPLPTWEDEQSVYVEGDAPGVTDQDIDVSVHGGDLIIRGERKGGGYDTRTYERFEQRVTLPCPVNANKAEAKLASGVLSLTQPKSEAAKPRKIAVKSE